MNWRCDTNAYETCRGRNSITSIAWILNDEFLEIYCKLPYIAFMSNGNSEIHRGFHKRGYLPHFDEPGLFQSITFRLIDSISPQKMKILRHEYLTDDSPDYFETLDAELDQNHGKCWLQQSEIARLVEDALHHYEGEIYRLMAWVIMPHHVHCLIHHLEGYALADIVRNWKARSGVRANKLLGRSGKFWQPDYFDRYIRNKGHLAIVADYIHFNPVAAGLCKRMEDWQWSSYRHLIKK